MEGQVGVYGVLAPCLQHPHLTLNPMKSGQEVKQVDPQLLMGPFITLLHLHPQLPTLMGLGVGDPLHPLIQGGQGPKGAIG